MPKFASTIKSLLENKDKLFELSKIPLNENCSVMLLKKLPKNLADPGKFLIPCDFLGRDVCHALADLGMSINLMPLSIWKNLFLPKLRPTRMTLELADRSLTRPKGVTEDVFVKVRKFHFLTDFVVVDFEANPRVPLILWRSFLRTDRALIDVYGEVITLQVNDEAVNFNLNQTTRYSSTYDDLPVNRIDVIDVVREEYAQEILEIEAYVKDDSISLEIDHADCDPEGDIFLIEKLLNDDPFSLPPTDLKQGEVAKAKSSIEEPPELELKDLPSHLEYAYLEGLDELPAIIEKDLKDNEKDALLKKGGITVVENENNELIPTRLVACWRVCIDYRKLNDATGSLLSNTIANPRGDLKVITTRSGVSYNGPTILPTSSPLPKEVKRETEATKDKVQTADSGSIAHVQPPVVQVPIPEPDVAPNPNPELLHFDLSFADALLHMPKFASTFKSILNNKENIFELENTLLNESCLAKLSLSELTPTRMTLELANRSVAYPVGVAEDVFVKVGKFYFSTEFVVINYDVDPRVPLILGRPFLRTARALIDIYGEELTLLVNDESTTFNVGHTSRYSYRHDDESVNRIDVIDVTCKQYAQEGGDFILEEIEACLTSDSIPSRIVDADFDPDGDILLLEKLLNDDPSSPLPLKEIHFEELKIIKSSIDDPSELKLKDLPSHLEYAFLEGTDKLLVIISKELKDEEKAALLKVLKSHKQAIAWKISDIKGIDPYFCTHKILMEDDFKLAVQHQRKMVSRDIFIFLLTRKTKKISPSLALMGGLPTDICLLAYVMLRALPKSDKLDDALWAFHIASKTSIGCTPYKLVYRKACHLLIELEHKAYWALKRCNFDLKSTGDHQKVQMNDLNKLRDQAYENSLIYKEKTKKIHDSKIKNHVFNVGDRVLFFISRLKIFSGKLKTRWIGPFTITQVFPYGTVELSQTDGPIFKVNGHRLKHYFRGYIPPMVVPDLQTFPMDH
nr:reverse transcriptase domain-containing protein [Tanacetum cinerariifolium]